REILDHDVAARTQVFGYRDALGALQVERDAAFPLVVLVEVAARVGGRLLVAGVRGEQPRHAEARRGLDTDHLGPEVRELQGAERTRPHPGEVGDADSLQRRAAGHWQIPSATSASTSTSTSASTSRVCWPRVGAGERSIHGVAESL